LGSIWQVARSLARRDLDALLERREARTRPYDGRMADTLRSADVIAAARAAEAALRPVIGRDWSVQAGPLEPARPPR
jgi:hypothetical protein